MNEPSSKPRRERLWRTFAFLLLPLLIAFALYTALLPCAQGDLLLTEYANVDRVASHRLPWFCAGLVAVVLAWFAVVFLRKSSEGFSAETRTGTGCVLGCLGTLFC